MEIDIPQLEEAKIWLMNDDGSAMPMTRFMAEQELGIDDWYEEAPKLSTKIKAGYAVRKKSEAGFR